MRKDFLSILDLGKEEIESLIDEAIAIKKKRKELRNQLEGRHFVLIFEKPSLRTRVTFEVAINRLGGSFTYLSNQDIRMGERESIKDIARNLEKWVDGVIARVYFHSTLVELSEYSGVPVINALSEMEHPCQALADFMTIKEFAGSYKVNLSFIGDGNNVAHSLMLLSAYLGTNFTIASPPGYEPKKEKISKALELARTSGSKIQILNTPKEAVRNADFIYTDVWTSMGQEKEAEERRKIFRDFQVNDKLLSFAPERAKVMHCLPAKRGEEITDEVIDGPRAIVYEQAENRLYTTIALLSFFFGEK